MKLPDTFKFYHRRNRDTIYTAQVNPLDRSEYFVSWEGCNNPVEYYRREAENCLREQTWIYLDMPRNNKEALHLLKDKW